MNVETHRERCALPHYSKLDEQRCELDRAWREFVRTVREPVERLLRRILDRLTR